MVERGSGDVSTNDPTTYPMAPRRSGLWVPERLVPSEQRLSDHIGKYTTVGLTIATGLTYLLGVWSVARFSEGVGAGATDLGFDFRDYLLLAFLNLFPILLGVLIAVPTIILAPRVKIAGAIIVAGISLGIAFIILVLLFYVVEMGIYNVMSMTIGIYAGGLIAGSALFYFQQGPTRNLVRVEPQRLVAVIAAVAGFVAAAILVIYFAGESSEEYGRRFGQATVESIAPPANIPFGLGLLINPEKGVATAGDVSECVTRIRGNVVSNGHDVIVLKELDRFVSEPRCTPSQAAFTPSGTIPRVVVLDEDVTKKEIEDFNSALATKLQVIPGSDFLARALVAAIDLCGALDGSPPLPTDEVPELRAIIRNIYFSLFFAKFDGNDLSSDVDVRVAVLRMAGRKLCPEHEDKILEYIEALTNR